MLDDEARGKPHLAIGHLASAFAILTGDSFNPCEPWLKAELVLLRARLHSQAGDLTAAAADYAEAARFYQKAGGRGHARAQANLGIMYEEGEGVTKAEGEGASAGGGSQRFVEVGVWWSKEPFAPVTQQSRRA